MPEPTDRCVVCHAEFGFVLPSCGFCERHVCSSCAVRLAGNAFCGRPCADAFFYGDEEDVGTDEGEAGGETE